MRVPSNADDSAAVVTRSGSRIAFLRTVGSTTNVWVANPDGLHARQITRTREPKQDLAWSPDGRRLAFAVCTNGSCRRGIDVVDADGANLRRVVNDALQPSWSPDSRKLVYAGETASFGDPSAIDVISIANGVQHRIAPVGTRPQWQPRLGRWILYDGPCGNGGDLCVVRTNSADRHVLADGDAAVWSPRGDRVALVGNEVGLGIVRLSRPRRVRWIAHRVDVLPAWSSDAKLLAYVEKRPSAMPNPVSIGVVRVQSGRSFVVDVEPPTTTISGLSFAAGGRLVYGAEVTTNDFELYSFRPGTKGVRQLTSDFVDERDPAWSRDGTHIAYVRANGWSPWQNTLWVAAANGSHRVQVAASAGALCSDPAWAPDGRHVAFVRTFDDSQQTQVAVVDIATLKVRVLSLPDARYASPAWSPDGSWLALDADGVLSLVRPDGTDLHAVVPGTAIGASWSPDGSSLAYIEETAPGTFRVSVAEVAGGTVRGIAADPSPDGGEPAWSPDGAQIVFARSTETGFTLVSVAPDGTGEHAITTAPSANVDPAFVR
ncbi:MAG: hypothetical protein ACYDA3_01660 [Gaiellaceae bacterium]